MDTPATATAAVSDVGGTTAGQAGDRAALEMMAWAGLVVYGAVRPSPDRPSDPIPPHVTAGPLDRVVRSSGRQWLRGPDRVVNVLQPRGAMSRPRPREGLLVPPTNADRIERQAAAAGFTAQRDIAATITDLERTRHVNHLVDAQCMDCRGPRQVGMTYHTTPSSVPGRRTHRDDRVSSATAAGRTSWWIAVLTSLCFSPIDTRPQQRRRAPRPAPRPDRVARRPRARRGPQ